jgi:hypothetical protein
LTHDGYDPSAHAAHDSPSADVQSSCVPHSDASSVLDAGIILTPAVF